MILANPRIRANPWLSAQPKLSKQLAAYSSINHKAKRKNGFACENSAAYFNCFVHPAEKIRTFLFFLKSSAISVDSYTNIWPSYDLCDDCKIYAFHIWMTTLIQMFYCCWYLTITGPEKQGTTKYGLPFEETLQDEWNSFILGFAKFQHNAELLYSC